MIHIYTDGGCSGNPGPGGWAYVMVPEAGGNGSVAATVLTEQWGAEKETTNNRMELLAVISALKALKAKPVLDQSANDVSSGLKLYTDSQYVQKGITQWIHKWKRNSWLTSDKKPVKNQDLWMELDTLAAGFSINWVWVKGHAGNLYNERCDALTQTAIASVK